MKKLKKMLISKIKNIILACSAIGFAVLTSVGTKAQSNGYEIDLDNIMLPTDTLYIDDSEFDEEVYGDIKADFINYDFNNIINSEKLKPAFDILNNSNRPLRILHIGDSHIAGKRLPLSIKQHICDVLGGSEDDSQGTGIYFSYYAKNGATAERFITPERLREIKSRRPDLIIMSFGTNECHGMGYSESAHRAGLRTAVNEIRSVCPNAVILLTTPPGDYLSKRTRYYVRRNGRKRRRYKYTREHNPMVVRCATLIRNFANSEGMPVWDLNTIAGGDKAAENWASHELMQKDFVHFLPHTYVFQGELFSEAFIKAYNDYIESNYQESSDEEASNNN